MAKTSIAHSVLTAAAIMLCSVGVLSVDVEVNLVTNGTYSIAINGKTWLESSEYRVDSLTSADGSLVQVGGSAASSGTDKLGDYQSFATSWAASTDKNTILMVATIKTYNDDDGLIVFSQEFPEGRGPADPIFLPTTGVRDNLEACRVASGPSNLTYSAQKYTAYTRDSNGLSFSEHPGNYCDDGHQWSYTSEIANETQCKDLCNKYNCSCYDYTSKVPAPPSGSLSARTIFPSFKRNSGPADNLDSFSYHGVFPSMQASKV